MKSFLRTFLTVLYRAPVQLVWKFLKLLNAPFWRAFDHDAFSVAKASAYSGILSLFPALLVLGAVLATSRRFEVYVLEISTVLGRMLTGSPTPVGYLRSRGERSISLLISASILTVWTASGVVIFWIEGFRNAYHLPKIWGLVKERVIACSPVLLAGLPMSVATILVAFGSQIEGLLLFHFGHDLRPFILLMWTGLRWVTAILTSVAVIALIYHNAIPRTKRWHTVLPGTGLATGMWFGATLIFGWYLKRYGEYNLVYGSLGVAIALLVWMFLVSLIVLIGAEFNALLFPRTVERPAHQNGAPPPDRRHLLLDLIGGKNDTTIPHDSCRICAMPACDVDAIINCAEQQGSR